MSISVQERVNKHRKKLRASGLRPVQIWVPDTREEKFIKECQKQSLLISNDDQENETLNWMEQVSDTEGWV